MYRVGHPVYEGDNRETLHAGYREALRELLSRGVSMSGAHRALAQARAGSHATCTVYRRAPSGVRYASAVVEVVRR